MAKNGPEFETRIRQNEVSNKKFNFLNAGDPYNAYYNHKVKEFKENRSRFFVSEACVRFLANRVHVDWTSSVLGQDAAAATTQKSVPITTQLKQQELLKQAQTQEQPFVPKDPPPEYEFVADAPCISALDL